MNIDQINMAIVLGAAAVCLAASCALYWCRPQNVRVDGIVQGVFVPLDVAPARHDSFSSEEIANVV